MHIRSILTIVLGATALWTASPTANATLPIYNAGEIFLGFRTADGATDYLVNIGNVTQFANLSPGSSVTVNTGGNISIDLAAAFDNDWFSSGQVLWGAFGATWSEAAGDNNVLFATRVRDIPGIQSVPWASRSDTGQALSVTDLKGAAQYYSNFGEATANSTKGTFQSAAGSNSWAHYTALGSDFRLGGSLEGGVGSVLDLYQIDPLAAPGQKGTLLGTFTINNSGTVTFTAVPEPSTVVLLGLAGFGSLLFVRQRRANARA